MFRFLLIFLILFTHSAYATDDNFEAIKMAAEQGDALAQFNLGSMYYKGEGAPEDIVKAVAWFLKAAEQGHAQAQSFLGSLYDIGEGVPEDDAVAVRWYRKAAEQGFAQAQLLLGIMYSIGEGVPEDILQAYAWLSIAAAQDDDQARELKALIAYDMTNAQIAKAQKLSRKYWEVYGPER